MRNVSVLVVDDDRDFAESLVMAIEGRGHRVDVAFSGSEAIKRFRAEAYDIAFMDVRLPGMNGVESFMEIRKMVPNARVVMMTGYSVGQLLQQAVENGAWGVLHKPFDMEDLLDMIERIKPDGILVADDDADFAKNVSDLLTSHGWRVFIAENGRQAVERIRSGGIDILVLDLRMPILDGLETYLELKQTGHALPTILVTAYAAEESSSIDKLTSLSISGILKKPFDPGDLIAAVEQLAPRGRE
jgi:two-component system response regulator HydG